jgi:predicted rRNA methylase YqxC with S4 and FtsJ domains
MKKFHEMSRASARSENSLPSKAKLRIDKLLVERGFAPTRQRAQSMVIAGRVLVNGQKVEKSGAAVEQDAELRLLWDRSQVRQSRRPQT